MRIIFTSFLFFISLFSIFLFSYKISRNYFKIKDNLAILLSSFILHLSFLIFISNLLLYFKVYNFFYFFIISIPFLFLSFNELKGIKIQKIELKLPFIYKFLLSIFIFVLFFIFQEAIITPPLSWDSLYYHMVQSASFVQKGGFATLDFDGILGTFKNHPKNFEIFLSIFLLAYRSDFISNLCNFYFLIIMILSSIIFLKEFSFSKKRIILFIINFITIPAFFIYLPTQYIEIASLSLVISSFSFLKIYEKEKNLSFLLLSSISFAIAFSFKAYNLLPFLIGNSFIIFLLIKDKKIKFYFLSFLILLNLLFSMHYLKMFYIYKNPAYPYPLKIFGKDFGKTNPLILDYINKMKEREDLWFSKYSRNLSNLEKKIAPYFYTIFTMFSQNHQALGRPAFLYVLLGFIGLFFLKDKLWKIFLIVQILFFLLQFFSPQMEPLRIMFSLSYSRIFLFPIFIFLFLSLNIFEKFKIYEVIFMLGFFTNIVLILPPFFLPFHIYIFIFAIIFILIFVVFFFKYPKPFLILFFFIFILISPILSKIKEANRLYFYLNYYHVSRISKTVFPVATILNGKSAKIHCHILDDYFAPDPVLLYPLIGTKFENEIVFVNPEGKTAEEWIEALKKENVELILLKGLNSIDFQWCLKYPENFKLLMEKEEIFVYNFNPK